MGRLFSRPGAAAGVAAIGLLTQPTRAQERPAFRSSIDVIAVDVQVVDATGRPLPRLDSGRFEVEINGQKRRVLSADFIEHADADGFGQPAGASLRGNRATPPPARTYVIGVDVASFTVAESRAIIEGAREFIRRLQPEDSVGIYAFPVGPKFRPSTDHAAILTTLQTVVGSREALHNERGLSALDVIDIMAETAKSDLAPIMQAQPTGRGGQQAQGTTSETLDEIVGRECGVEDRPCAQAILAEAQGMSFIMQGQAVESLSGLRQLVRALGSIEGRKTLVLLSAGMPVSDRPGGRPDVGELPRLLGQEAAGTNTTIYALMLETEFSHTISVKTQRPSRSFGSGRQQDVFGRVMDEFAGASGGAVLPIAQGTGIGQIERVLRETSSRYLLGVEPAPEDRDGKLRRLQVKVKNLPRGATIRSRQWVVVPKPRTS